MATDLKQKTITALVWNFIEKFGQQIIYMLAGVIVARLVTPQEYGLFAVLGVFITFSTILAESGFSSTLIRRQQLKAEEISTVFIFNIAISISLYLILFFCAPFIAQFFNAPELTWIARALFSSVIFYSASLIQQVQLTRQLELELLSKINLMSLLIASVLSITMAYYGYGVWALVAQNVGLAFLRMALLWSFGTWGIGMKFSLPVLRSFFSFSSKLLMISMLNAIVNNINSFLIGKRFPKAEAGYYFNANKYQEIPGNIIGNTFRTVLLPVISKVNEEPERARRVLSRVMGTMAVIVFPSMMLLNVVARPFITILISDVWLPAVPIFKVLCIAGAFAPFTILFNEVFVGMGRINIILVYELVRKGIFLISLPLILQFGVMALAWLWVGYTIFSVGFAIFFLRSILGYGISELLSDIAVPFITSAILAAAVAMLSETFTNNFLQIALQGSIMGFLYIITLIVLREPNLMEGIDMIKKKLLK